MQKLFEVLLTLVVATAARADAPRVLDGATDDARLGPLVSTRTGYFPFDPPESKQEWAQRSVDVRRRVQVAAGLWPPPERHAPRAVVHGRVERDDYTVEKVYLESAPGHYVTGNLYRPKGHAGARPGVLCPHGHWSGGRYHEWTEEETARQIEAGAERYEVGGRYPLQARCVQLARMGCVVFMYDMLGYGDSQQLSNDTVHNPSQETILDTTEDGWGFHSTEAELRVQNTLGLQTLNSQYALDWLMSLGDVDPERIAVTGGSSGATQTLMLCAVDPRPDVAFPVVMVSTAMQGGCPCENACALRVGTGNVEIAGLFAPKPLGMASADDWTRETITKGFPELQQLYRVLGAPEKVMIASLTQYPHNYNHASRAAMYPWLNRWLPINAETPIAERDFVPLADDEIRVWNADHPAPPGGPEHERALLQAMTRASKEQLEQLTPHDAQSLAEFRRVVGGAFETLLACEPPTPDEIELESTAESDHGSYAQRCAIIRRPETGAALPTIVLAPATPSGESVLWISGDGKAGAFDDAGQVRSEVRRLLNAGVTVIAGDLLYQGELNPSDGPIDKTRVVDDPKPAAGLTYGYNRTVLAHRAADVLTLAAAARKLSNDVRAPHVLSVDGSAPYVAAAVAIGGDNLGAAAIDSGGFRFETLGSWRDPNFLPGAVKYGDLPAMVALGAPRALWLAGEADAPPLLAAAYRAAGRRDFLTISDVNASADNAVRFLLARITD